MNDELDTLAMQAVLQEFEFRSEAGLIARLRAAWHSVAGKWADRYLAQQQTRFNQAVVQQLRQAAQQLRQEAQQLRQEAQQLQQTQTLELDDLSERTALSDHDLTDLARNLAELTQQVIQLQRALSALQASAVRSRQE